MIGLASPRRPPVETTPFPALWADYRERGEEAVDRLLEAYLPLMHRVLERIAIRLPSHVALEDLSQAALIGLYKAIVNFKSERGVPFEGYAYTRIRGAVLDELRANDKLSRSKRAMVNRVETVVAEWMKDHGEMPGEDEIAEQLGLTMEDFLQLMDESRPWCSLDAAEGDSTSLHETIADPTSQSEKEAQRHDLQQLLRKGFRMLDNRDQKILYLYYFEELRLSEIAELFDLTEARISQIHALAVVRLRAALLEAFPSEFAA